MSDRIWAPWRLPYIVSEKESPGCFLCQAAAESSNIATSLTVQRASHTVTVLNRYPYTNGHLLVAPLAHKATLAELSNDEMLQCSQVLRQMIGVLDEVIHPHGYNVGLNLGKVAGAGLPGHLHWHLVPRWEGDTNFMPTVASARVIPQSLEDLHDAIVAVLQSSND